MPNTSSKSSVASDRSRTLAGLAREVRSTHPARFTLGLRLADRSVAVSSNEQGLILELADYFRAFLGPADAADIRVSVHQAPAPDLGGKLVPREPEPGKSGVKEEYLDLPDGRAVRKRRTGVVLLFGGGDNLAVGPCRENLNQVVNFINNRFIESKLREGGVLGHAAGVALDGSGLALAGASGSGKSTLALKIVGRGADFVSNDRVVVQREEGPGLRMTGVPKLPRINPGTIVTNPNLSGLLAPQERASYQARPLEELWCVERKYDVPIDRCFGPGRFRLSVPLRALAILSWCRDLSGPTRFSRVDPARRRDMLRVFAKSPGLFGLADSGPPPLEEYVGLLSLVPVYEVSGGTDFDLATERCLDLLGSPGSGQNSR